MVTGSNLRAPYSPPVKGKGRRGTVVQKVRIIQRHSFSITLATSPLRRILLGRISVILNNVSLNENSKRRGGAAGLFLFIFQIDMKGVVD